MEGVQEEKRKVVLRRKPGLQACYLGKHSTDQPSRSSRQEDNIYDRNAKSFQPGPSSVTDHILKLRFADRYVNSMPLEPRQTRARLATGLLAR